MNSILELQALEVENSVEEKGWSTCSHTNCCNVRADSFEG